MVSHRPGGSGAESDDPPIVLILAGGSINERLRHLGMRALTPALLPVHTRPLAAYVLDFYLSQRVTQILLGVQAEHLAAVRSDLLQYASQVRLVPLPYTNGVVGSLRSMLSYLPPEAPGDCIVNLVTTIPTTLVAPLEILIAEKESDPSVGSAVEPSPTGRARFYFKSDPRPRRAQPFTGVFRLGTAQLRAAATAAQRTDDLLAVVSAANVNWRCRPVPWIDCGHEVNFYDARARLVASRSFNHLAVDHESGIVCKRSAASAKLRDEAAFLEALPPPLRILFPRVITAYEEKDGVGQYSMEYYGYPNVAEYLLYWDLSAALWHRMFDQFSAVLRKFSVERTTLPVGAYEEFYVRRTSRRLEDFLRRMTPGDTIDVLRSGRVRVNGEPIRRLEDLVLDAQRLALTVPDGNPNACVMHGDFCFNNILYDVASGVVRLIDPRGSFGAGPSIFGDARYDLAKLMHSAVGRYDAIANGLYTVATGSGYVDYTLGERAASDACEHAMARTLAELHADERTIRALMGLVFLTMLPLHADSPNRQLVLFAHGLRILTDTLA